MVHVCACVRVWGIARAVTHVGLWSVFPACQKSPRSYFAVYIQYCRIVERQRFATNMRVSKVKPLAHKQMRAVRIFCVAASPAWLGSIARHIYTPSQLSNAKPPWCAPPHVLRFCAGWVRVAILLLGVVLFAKEKRLDNFFETRLYLGKKEMF